MTRIRPPADHRHFQRIPFDAQVTINGDDGTWSSELIDSSLKGALVGRPNDWHAETGRPFELSIQLAPGVTIGMQASVAHSEADHVGFRCDHIDVESISHLCRLVELNTGEPELVHRELNALTRLNETD
jgi:hypothetical protein